MAEAGLVVGEDGQARCFWCVRDPLYRHYHDAEWGRPVADDRALFEKLCLEGFQAGLSWYTILKKREALRRAFAGFEIERLACFGPREVAQLLQDPAIVRHRGKIEAVMTNARAALAIIEKEGSLARLLWRFAPEQDPPPPRDAAELQARTTSPEAIALAAELKRRGFRFFGPTTAYAFMQAMGFVNDHLEGCAVRPEVEAQRAGFRARLM